MSDQPARFSGQQTGPSWAYLAHFNPDGSAWVEIPSADAHGRFQIIVLDVAGPVETADAEQASA